MGIIPIYEPGLEDLVIHNQRQGRLNFTTNAHEGVQFGDLQIIAVGTPPNEDGSADLQHVLAVAKTIGRHMHNRKIIVNKSTVPVGTASKVRQAIEAELGARSENLISMCVPILNSSRKAQPSRTSARVLELSLERTRKRFAQSCASAMRRTAVITTR